MDTFNKILKNRSLLFSLIVLVLLIVIVTFLLINRSSNNLNNSTNLEMSPSMSSCQRLCEKATNTCDSLRYSVCLDMCSSWTNDQKNCVMKTNSCDSLYDNCNIDDTLVYEPELQTECQTACDSYVRLCNVHDDLSKVVNDLQMFDDCVSDCDTSWDDDLRTCVINSTSCSQMITTCQ